MLLYKVIHVAFKVNIFISSEGMWLNEMKTKFVKEGRKLKWRAKGAVPVPCADMERWRELGDLVQVIN